MSTVEQILDAIGNAGLLVNTLYQTRMLSKDDEPVKWCCNLRTKGYVNEHVSYFDHATGLTMTEALEKALANTRGDKGLPHSNSMTKFLPNAHVNVKKSLEDLL